MLKSVIWELPVVHEYSKAANIYTMYLLAAADLYNCTNLQWRMIENSFSLSSTKYFIEDVKSAAVLINVDVDSLQYTMMVWIIISSVYLQVSDASFRTKTVSSMKNSSIVEAD